ncbi:probable thiamine-biosynthesis protein [gamma proteobacterium HdN1]|nr:probable thiamine-biosynthesis protein [gamma proteobacterium HdN1]
MGRGIAERIFIYDDVLLMTHSFSPSQDGPLKITLNGELAHFAAGSTIADVVARMALGDKRIAVERNQEIVPKSLHAQTALAAGDVIEIVHAIGGG